MAPLMLHCYYRLCGNWLGVWLSGLLLAALTAIVTAWTFGSPRTTPASLSVLSAQVKHVRYEAADPRVGALATPYVLSVGEASKRVLKIMQQAGVLGSGVQFQRLPTAPLLQVQGEVRTTYAAWSLAMAQLSQQLPFTRLQTISMQQQDGMPGQYLINYQLQLPVKGGRP